MYFMQGVQFQPYGLAVVRLVGNVWMVRLS